MPRSAARPAVSTRADDPTDPPTRPAAPPPTQLDGVGPGPAGDDGPLAAGSTFAGRYHVKRRIGTGGMGAVYQAFDTVLSEDVAIKLIRPDILADPIGAADIERRFKRELLLGRRVSDPRVVRVHDFGAADGLRFLTMSYVDGRDLARVVQDEGAMEPARVIRIGRRLATALAAVHAAGVIHRDLKPANVMLGRGDEVWLTDFGIARLVSDPLDAAVAADPGAPTHGSAHVHASSPANDAGAAQAVPRAGGARVGTLTTLGARIGTPEYMAPEQADGGRVDERTDVYALALILYDLLTGGARRTRYASAEAELQARRAAAPHVRVQSPEVPEALDATLARALDPDPARRYPSAASLAEALASIGEATTAATTAPSHAAAHAPVPGPAPARARRRIGAVVGALALVAIVGAAIWRAQRDEAASADAAVPPTSALQPTADAGTSVPLRSVAVLAFADLSPQRDQEYLADGLADELMNELAQVPGLRVPGRTSSFYFKGKSVPVPEIGRQLGVAHLLEGSVRKAGDRLRIGATLVRASDGGQVWSKTFDRTGDDVFAVQDEIAAAVAWALSVSLPQSIAQERPANAEAFDLYLKAQTVGVPYTLEAQRAAADLLRQAIALDPKYARAWTDLSGTLNTLADITKRDDYLREAQAAAERAIALAPDRAHGYLARVAILEMHHQDWAAARRDLERAAALEPRDNSVRFSLAYALYWQGRIAEAIEAYERLVETDPFRTGARVNLGYLQTAAGRRVEARRSLTRALELNPGSASGLLALGELDLLEGRPGDALSVFARVEDEAFRLYGTAIAEHSRGDRARSDAALRELIAKNSADSAYQIAAVYAWRGEKDRAFEWLERARVQRDGGLTSLLIDPVLGSLRQDARWSQFVTKVGLAADQGAVPRT